MFTQMKQRTARKAHACSLCQEPIEPGQTYYEYTGLYNDKFFGERYHPECERLIEYYNAEVNDENDYCSEDIITWLHCDYCQDCERHHECTDNPEKFRASCARGATLSDYLELDKIKDPALREQALDAVGTNNFRQVLAAAIGEEKCRERLKFVVAEISPWAEEIPSGYKGGEYLYLRNYGRWNWTQGEHIEQPEDAAPGVYYFYVGKEQIDLFRKHSTEPEKSEEDARKERLNAAANHQIAVLGYLDRQMYELRCEFVLNLSDSELERNREAVEAFAASTLSHAYCDGYRRLQNEGLMNDLVDLPAELACFDKREERREWIDELAQTKPLRVLFAAAYAAVDDDDCGYHVSVWDADTGTRAKYTRNRALDRVYALLERLGYEMSDEELELQNGTHPAYTLEVDE